MWVMRCKGHFQSVAGSIKSPCRKYNPWKPSTHYYKLLSNMIMYYVKIRQSQFQDKGHCHLTQPGRPAITGRRLHH